MLCPEQVAPPFEGSGLLQRRVWVRLPPPQGTVHPDQLPHAPQFPAKINDNFKLALYVLPK